MVIGRILCHRHIPRRLVWSASDATNSPMSSSDHGHRHNGDGFPSFLLAHTCACF